jgi:hypothetical protein
MYRGYLLATGLFFLMLAYASAEVYRCRTTEGRLIMTDQQTNLPAGCTPIDNPPGSGSFNIMPSTEERAVQSPAKQSEEAPRPDTTGRSALQDQAEVLIQSYNDAVTRRYHSSRVVEQQKAIREITELRQKKREMLDSLAQSGLSRDERKSVRNILDGIPSR